MGYFFGIFALLWKPQKNLSTSKRITVIFLWKPVKHSCIFLSSDVTKTHLTSSCLLWSSSVILTLRLRSNCNTSVWLCRWDLFANQTFVYASETRELSQSFCLCGWDYYFAFLTNFCLWTSFITWLFCLRGRYFLKFCLFSLLTNIHCLCVCFSSQLMAFDEETLYCFSLFVFLSLSTSGCLCFLFSE